MALRAGDGTGSLEKAIDVLEEIGRQPGGISHNELAERLAMPRTTVYRLLATLVTRGLARHDPSRRIYNLGVRYVELARQTYAMPDLVAAAAQELRDLRDLTGETSYIGTLEGTAVVSLERFDGAHSHRSNAGLGHRKPVYATSQGKALLAALDVETREALIAKLHLVPLTEHTLTDRRRLNAQLRATRERGWAIDNEENVLGVRCVGAAVRDPYGTVRGAISVAGPAYRLPLARIELLGPELAEAARRIGARLERTEPSGQGADVGVTLAAPSLYGAFPTWYPETRTLVWADALAPALRMMTAGTDRPIVRLDHPVTGLFLREGRACLVHDDGATEVDMNGATRPLPNWRDMEIQAITLHPGGEAWAALATPSGSVLGRISTDGGFRREWSIDEPVQAICWSTDGRHLHAAAPASGSIFLLRPGSERVQRLATVPRGGGLLGGLAVDTQGGLWMAMRDGWSVMRLRDDGSFDRSIPLPVPYPTGVTIGGEAMDRLYVTTARQPVAPDALKSAPLSGRLFEIRLSDAE